MIKRFMLCFLCLAMAVSACLAEAVPGKGNYCRVSMHRNVPEKTMREVFADYMVPGCEAEYDDYRAACPSLLTGGVGWFSFYNETGDDEQIRACREIAESLLRTVYPDYEAELISAMPLRNNLIYSLYDFTTFEIKDGQWYFLGTPLTHELEGILTAAHLTSADSRKQIEETDPSWILLQYHPGPVCGLPLGMDIPDTEENLPYCLTTFIFDGDRHLVSVCLGGSFTAIPTGKETEIRITKEEALRLAREQVARENEDVDSRGFDWDEYIGDTYGFLLQELGYSSIRSELVLEEDSARLVMAMNQKGELQPAWEFAQSFSVIADEKVIKEHQFATGYYFYLSAEDGSVIRGI